MIPPSFLYPTKRLTEGPEPRKRSAQQYGAWTAAAIGGLSAGMVAAIVAVTLAA